jgi:phosphoribosylanthranilate isomerase
MGVFVNADSAQILDTARRAGLAGAQLHGDEPPELCRALRRAGLEVWKSIPVGGPGCDAAQIMAAMRRYDGAVDALLLDTAPPRSAPTRVTGGFGIPFDWGILPELRSSTRHAGIAADVWIAGGLNADNVGQLLDLFQPTGVDVSSGVEQDGRKSPAKIESFLEVIRGYDPPRHVS